MQQESAGYKKYATKFLSEPLIHFLILGVLLFGADALITKLKDSRRVIEVPGAVKSEAHDLFVAGMHREPSEKDMKQILERWVDNEVLYREGIALGLDKGDQNIRERIIFKALSVTQAGINLPASSPEQLESWYQARADRYALDDRFNFFEAVVAGPSSAEQLKQFAAVLNGKGSSDVESSLRIFKDRPRKSIIEAYGDKFTADLAALQPGMWTVLISKSGPHLVQLGQIYKGEAVNYSDISERVLADWQQETMAQLTSQAIRELGKKYRVNGLVTAP
jgi:hypothetical protein